MDFKDKKVYIIVALCVAIVIIVAVSIWTLPRQNEKTVEFLTINSRDNLYSLTVPTTIDCTVGNSSEDLSLDIYDAAKSVYIYGNTIEKSREIDLFDVVNDDKSSYFPSKENVVEIANTHEVTINNCSGYEYTMSYLDKEYGKEFYCNVLWLQTENHIFTLNFEVLNENAEQFKPIFEQIKNSFSLI